MNPPHLRQDVVVDWDALLPSPEELTPITQTLIPPHLASAFRITSASSPSAPPQIIATQTKLTHSSPPPPPPSSASAAPALVAPEPRHSQRFRPAEEEAEPFAARFKPCAAAGAGGASLKLEAGLWDVGGGGSPVAYEGDSTGFPGVTNNNNNSGSENGWGRVKRTAAELEMEVEAAAADSGGGGQENSSGGDPAAAAASSGRTPKRPRLVWTPQLHKRFVDAVAHLGIKSAVPKTIMQLMNVDGLTRENVASHLQKYRLYLKRMQGLSSEGPSVSDQLFASTPVPPSLASAAHFLGAGDEAMPLVALPMPIPMPIPRAAGINPAHFAASSSSPSSSAAPLFLNNYDHHNHHHHHHHNHSLYPSFPRPSPPHRSFLPPDPQDCLLDAQQSHPPPSQKQVLTLFPSTGT